MAPNKRLQLTLRPTSRLYTVLIVSSMAIVGSVRTGATASWIDTDHCFTGCAGSTISQSAAGNIETATLRWAFRDVLRSSESDGFQVMLSISRVHCAAQHSFARDPGTVNGQLLDCH